MATVTSPIITDDTGQDIKTAINALANAISPAAANVTFNNTDTSVYVKSTTSPANYRIKIYGCDKS